MHWEAYAVDAHRGTLVRYGGSTGVRDGRVGYDMTTWEWTDTGWRAAVLPDQGPGSRHAHGMAYHPDRREVFLAGGMRVVPGKEESLCDAWQYNGRRWSPLESGPCGASGTTLVFDTRRRWMLWVDGNSIEPGGSTERLRLWRWTPDAWVLVDPEGPRYNPSRSLPDADA